MSQAVQLDRVLRLPEVEETVGQKKSQIYRLIRAGQFPLPVKLGKRASGWRASEIAAYLARLAPANGRSEARP